MNNLLLYLMLFCISCIDRQTDASSLLPELQLAEELMFADTELKVFDTNEEAVAYAKELMGI
ncbi:MAG: hypothetical protein IKP48_04375 [Bacteroidaceae bacterium]|nr:hypothetical protein [Bacteroidaceae bacterium]